MTPRIAQVTPLTAAKCARKMQSLQDVQSAGARMIRRTLLAQAALAALGACAHDSPPNEVSVTIEAIVPANTGDVFLTGNLPALGPWKPDGLKMAGTGTRRTASLRAPVGFAFEYKVTLGSWAREGLGPSGTVMANSQLRIAAGAKGEITVIDFKKDSRVYLADPKAGGVVGDLTVWLDVASKHLRATRHVTVWTPPGYGASATRHRVIYMHDGQNLFDPRIANTGTDWGVDEAMRRLAADGVAPTIIVGVWSTDDRRLEYAPTKVIGAFDPALRGEVEREFGGAILGDAYLRFLAEDLKPRVDAAFRTQTGPADTFLAGSSMGGLISLYGVAERPDVFGAAACLSLHWPVAIRKERIFDKAADWRPLLLNAYRGYFHAAGLSPRRTRLWADHGTHNLDSLYGPYQEAMASVFAELGFKDARDLQLRVYPGADHNEAAWRARIDTPLRFLLAR
jgi:predicted alpha/beta superfamily hydrolase